MNINELYLKNKSHILAIFQEYDLEDNEYAEKLLSEYFEIYLKNVLDKVKKDVMLDAVFPVVISTHTKSYYNINIPEGFNQDKTDILDWAVSTNYIENDFNNWLISQQKRIKWRKTFNGLMEDAKHEKELAEQERAEILDKIKEDLRLKYEKEEEEKQAALEADQLAKLNRKKDAVKLGLGAVLVTGLAGLGIFNGWKDGLEKGRRWSENLK